MYSISRILFVVSLVFVSAMARAEFTVDPAYEGVYDIDVTCDGVVSPSECSNIVGKHRISVMNSMSSEGVRVTLSHGQYNFPLFDFSVLRYEAGGAVLEGDSLPTSPHTGEFHWEVDPSTRILKGWIWDSSISGTIRLNGKQRVSAGDWYSTEPAKVSLQDLEGSYDGASQSLKGRLILKRKAFGDGNTFTASFVNSSPYIVFTFPTTEFVPSRSVINLIGRGKDYVLKWTLQISSKDDGSLSLKGVGYSSSGKGGYTISAVKKSGLTSPLLP